MKPIIGINMSYCEYEGHGPDDVPRFRDAYKVYISYADAVRECGGIALLLPPFKDVGSLDGYLDMVHGFVFTGGDDYPPALYGEGKHPETKIIHHRRVAADVYIARRILASRKPVLGICGGIQLISIMSGGRLVQHIENLSMHNKQSKILDSAHTVTIKKGSLLHSIFGGTEIEVNSAHHQAIDPDHPGENLQVTASAPDGIIEALELENPEGRFFLAVQWHPERIKDIHHRTLLFNSLINGARSFSA